MDDIFAQTDLGDGNGSVQVTDAPQEQPAPKAPTDPTAAAEPAPSTEEATATQGEQVQDGTQQEQPTNQEAAEEISDEAKLEQEVEAALADEKTPKWFKNAVENVYKPKLNEAKASIEQYSQFGTPEELAPKLELLTGLETVRSNPQTGMPERTTEPFVKSLYEKDPQGAYQLITDLVTLPSPHTEGRTVLEEVINGIGIDPSRISDIQRFAANGYQMQASAYPAPAQEDLEGIPNHLHATFAKLDPDTRDTLVVMEDALRDRTLEAYKTDFETKERSQHEQQTQEQRAAELQAQQQAQFKAQVDQKGDENFQKAGETVLSGFVESLAKQAGMTALDSQMVANTVLNAYEPTLAGKATAAALKAAGIELDPTIPAAIQQLEEKAKHAAYYQITGDQTALSRVVSEQVELQQRILAKGNKIIAQLALQRNGNVIKPAQQNAAQLAQTQNSRHAVAGAGGQVNADFTPTYDFSDEAYEQAIAQDPFFQKGR